ncbi:MAG: chemotaxis protein CheA [Spirochaetaceae bacterium]
MSSGTDPLHTFAGEAADLLDAYEAALMALEEDPADPQEHVASAFRSLHTIKGSGTMLGLDSLASFAHRLENYFSALREGEVSLTREVVSQGLQAKDTLQALLQATIAEEDADLGTIAAEGEALLSFFEGQLSGSRVAEAAAGTPAPEAAGEAANAGNGGDGGAAEGTQTTYRITYRPSRETFNRGLRPLQLIKELGELGQCTPMGFTGEIPPLREMEPTACYVRWIFLLTTTASRADVETVFIFLDEESQLTVDVIDSPELLEEEHEYARLGEILVERGEIAPGELTEVLSERTRLGQLLVDRGLVDPEVVQSALKEQQVVRESRRRTIQTESQSTIKVRTDRLDQLINLVGEFVSLQAALSLRAAISQDGEITGLSEQLDRLVSDLRDLSMELHMVPIELLFRPFRRLVRDTGEELGKEVDLTIEGAETELDKNLVDLLKDPLMHIVRNAIDHGIESAVEREAAGKSRRGEIRLTARYSGTFVTIEVADNGRGLNEERILAKARERGLIGSETERLSQEEIVSLIMQPGFSTAEEVSDLSGRGVGMDVVARNIEGLGGAVAVESQFGEGTRIRIRVPLTLAIVEGLLCKVGEGYYLVNLAYIEECVDTQSLSRAGGETFEFRGRVLPLMDLRRFFGSDSNGSGSNGQGQVIVVSLEERRLGLVVDELLENFQSVIKPLGKLLQNTEGISGVVFLGDGTPALMLDVDSLVRRRT